MLPEHAPGVPSAAGLTYADLIVEALTRYPARDAFVLGDRRMTYAEAAALTSQVQQVLSDLGIGRHGAVGALSANVPEVWLVQAATYLLGAHYTGLHPLGSIDDHVFVCDDAELDVLLVHPDHAEAGAAIAARAGTVRRVLTLGASDLGEDLLALCDRYSPRPLEPGPADENDLSWLTYTGGTTGRPKGVRVPHRALVEVTAALPVAWGMPRDPRYLVVSPITHAGVLPIMPTLLQGGTVVLQQGFDPGAWLHAVHTEHVNFGFVVPTILYALLDHGIPPGTDITSLETVLYGAAPMSPARIAEARELLGPVLMQGYGQTESLGMGTSLRPDEHDPSHPELLSSCGRPVPGVRVALLDEDDQRVRRGEVGELCLRSRVVMEGYHRQPEQTATALSGGWLHTGDLARLDDAGFYHIVDRKKDLIISGGFNIYPKEIENIIAARPEVSAVAVIGVPDDRWGEAVTAVVAPRPGATVDPELVLAEVRAAKGPHQTPKTLECRDHLPTTPAGKIDKRALRRDYWSEQERQVH